MEFDWNPAKCAKNIAERGIDFADVLVAFIDPTRKVAEDRRKNKGKTDWKRLDRMTSTQVEAIAAGDRVGAPMTDAEWAKAEIVHPHKVAVGLKLDDDLLGWFKSQGKGYQTRINTILRRYYETHRKAG